MRAQVTAPLDLGSLLEDCQRGDRGAFRQLFEAFRPRVQSTARHILGSDAAAKDITQQVFLTVWRELERLRPDGAFPTWLYRVTVNACLSERKRWRRQSAEPPPDTGIGAGQEQAVLAAEVQAALARLSPRLRVPLVLRHVEGLSYEEIASVLGLSMGTVASRLSRGLEALTHAIEGRAP